MLTPKLLKTCDEPKYEERIKNKMVLQKEYSLYSDKKGFGEFHRI